MRRQIGLLGTFLLFSLASLAQSYSLQQAQDYASQHSYNLLEGRENVSKAKAQVNETISAGLPQIIGSAAYQNFIRQPVQAIPAEFFGGEPGTFATVVFGTKQNVNLDVTASQLLFDGSYLVGLKAAREVVELSRLQNKLTEQEVRKAVYDAYATAIAAQENYATLSASERNLEKLAEQTKKLREAGLADEISVSQIQINLSNLQNALQNAEIQIGLAKNLLKYTMGLPLDAQITLTSGIDEFTTVQMDQFQIDQFSSQRTTEMRLARQNTLLQEYRLKAERAGYLPRLSAYFSHQQNAFRQEFNFLSNTRDYFTTNVVGVNLNVPIFTSFKKRNQVKQKQIDLELANINMDKVREGMQLEISNAQAQLKFEYNNYKTQQTNLELTEKIREQTRTKFSEGLSSSFDLNQAENQYLNAQAAYIQSIIKVSSAKSKLEKLLNP